MGSGHLTRNWFHIKRERPDPRELVWDRSWRPGNHGAKLQCDRGPIVVHLRDVYVLNGGGGVGFGISLIFPALNNNFKLKMVFRSLHKMGNSGSLAEAEM